MKQFINSIREVCKNMKSNYIVKGIIMGMMLIAIFIHLLNADLSTAPEFIYNQF